MPRAFPPPPQIARRMEFGMHSLRRRDTRFRTPDIDQQPRYPAEEPSTPDQAASSPTDNCDLSSAPPQTVSRLTKHARTPVAPPDANENDLNPKRARISIQPMPQLSVTTPKVRFQELDGESLSSLSDEEASSTDSIPKPPGEAVMRHMGFCPCKFSF
jgi:hypothetical protein